MMSQITLDRELLQRVLDEYFKEWAEARAHLGMAQTMNHKRPDVGQRYFDVHERRTKEELSQEEGIRTRLSETLRTEDYEGFLYALKARFPASRHPVRKTRTGT
jgi:hypothetical protein